jgi:hypothetical protein
MTVVPILHDSPATPPRPSSLLISPLLSEPQAGDRGCPGAPQSTMVRLNAHGGGPGGPLGTLLYDNAVSRCRIRVPPAPCPGADRPYHEYVDACMVNRRTAKGQPGSEFGLDPSTTEEGAPGASGSPLPWRSRSSGPLAPKPRSRAEVRSRGPAGVPAHLHAALKTTMSEALSAYDPREARQRQDLTVISAEGLLFP